MSLKDTIRVLMPDEILHKVKYLCKMIPKVEWSGILFYDIKGTVKDPENMLITLKDILPMNKGTQAYTEYELDNRYIEYLMDNPEAMEWKMGHIHSHNTMGVFFSGTDMSELHDNSASHNFYFSLIVNNYMDFCAKLAFRGGVNIETDTLAYYALDENGEKYQVDESKFTVKKEKLYIHDCTIESTTELISVNDEFSKKVNGIIEAAKPKVVTYSNYGKPPAKTPIKNPVLDAGAGKNPIKQKASQIAKDFNIPIDELEEHTFFGEDTVGENSDIEEFLICILRGSNPSDEQVTNVEEALLEIEDLAPEGTTPEVIARSIIEKYPVVYEKYFEQEDNDHFIMVTEEVISILEDEEGVFPFISRTIMALKYMVNKLEEYGSTSSTQQV